MVRTVHAIKGRARFRVDGLRGSVPLQDYLEQILSGRQRITGASASALTGTVLVLFHPEQNRSAIAVMLEGIVAEFHNRRPSAVRYEESDRHLVESPSTAGILRPMVAGDQLPSGLAPDSIPWHHLGIDTVLDFFGTTPDTGLSDEAASASRRKYGANILPVRDLRSRLTILAEQFRSLPVALAGTVAALCLVSGNVPSALVILSVVAANASLGFLTESRAQKTFRLPGGFAKPRARVIRGGEVREMPADEVAWGDVVLLGPGSYVPADGRLIEANRLTVDESALTGECVPTEKAAGTVPKRNVPLVQRTSMVYRGTRVMGGDGKAVVVATGTYTELGTLHTLAGDLLSPESAIARQLDRVGRQMIFAGSIVGSIALLAALLRGYSFVRFSRTFLSLAAAAIPEGLSTLAISSLALSAREMQRNLIFVRHLRALGSLGSVQTVCFDKTGTLTLNTIFVVAVHTGMKTLRVRRYGFLLGEEGLDPSECNELLRLMQVGVLCTEAEISMSEGKVIIAGSSTEKALVDLAMRSGIDVVRFREQHPLLEISHRSEDQPFMRTSHRSPAGGILTAVKGSPVAVLDMCSRQLRDGREIPLTDEDRHAVEVENDRMAGGALRVLGVAYGVLAEEESGAGHGDSSPGGHVGHHGLVWLGLVGMADPIRDGARELIAAFHEAGIATAIITGDQSATAYAIGKELDLSGGTPLQIMDSTRLAKMDSEALAAIAERVHIFSRVNPTQKVHIVRAMQKKDKVVAMVGDGINDAPALRAADVGVAMGLSGTDIARETADLLLEDDDLRKIAVAIRNGRTAHENIRKSLRFLVTTDMSEILMKIPAVAGHMEDHSNPLPSIFRNLLCLSLSLDPPEPDTLKRSPRGHRKPILDASEFETALLRSIPITASALGAGSYGALRYGLGSRAAGLAFHSLAVGQILSALSSRSGNGGPAAGAEGILQPNAYLRAVLWGSLALQLLPALIPGLGSLLGIGAAGIMDAVMISGSALFSHVLNKPARKRRVAKRQNMVDSGAL